MKNKNANFISGVTYIHSIFSDIEFWGEHGRISILIHDGNVEKEMLSLAAVQMEKFGWTQNNKYCFSWECFE